MGKTNKNKENSVFLFRSVDMFWKVVGHYVIFSMLCCLLTLCSLISINTTSRGIEGVSSSYSSFVGSSHSQEENTKKYYQNKEIVWFGFSDYCLNWWLVFNNQFLSNVTAKQPLVFCCRLFLLGSFHAAGKCHALRNPHPQINISVITASPQLSELITRNGSSRNLFF